MDTNQISSSFHLFGRHIEMTLCATLCATMTLCATQYSSNRTFLYFNDDQNQNEKPLTCRHKKKCFAEIGRVFQATGTAGILSFFQNHAMILDTAGFLGMDGNLT